MLLAGVARELDSLEGRLLRVIRRSAKPFPPVHELTADLHLLLEDLHHTCVALCQILDRRDLTFAQYTEARRLLRHLTWLYRRIREEQFFAHKMHLEARLRALVCPEAFDIYQELQGLEYLEREFSRRTDEEIRKELEAGPPADV